MNFGASRLGFWFRQLNRSYKKKILFFYDPLTNGPGGNTNYYAGPDRNPATDLYPPLAARATALGFIPSLVTSFQTLNGLDLTEYAQLWDIGYATPYTTNPYNPTITLQQYLRSTGSLFILGENSSFQPRDNEIGTFIEFMGGGTGITEGTIDFNYSRNLTLQNRFIYYGNGSLVFSRPGVFTSFGNGIPITTGAFPLTGELQYPGVFWGAGQLSVAPIGSLMSILDLNFIVGPYQNTALIDNIIQTLMNQ